MVRRVAAALTLILALMLCSFGLPAHGVSSSEPERLLPVAPVEGQTAPAPPRTTTLDMGVVWAAAIARDPWPDLATNGTTGTFEGKVALTFDDGPDPRTTPLVLDALREHSLHATFFVVGRQVKQNPGLLRRIVKEGHTLGNHTYDHADMSEMSPEQMRGELRRTQKAVDEALGYHYPMAVMRPPYGDPYFDNSGALPAFREVVREQELFPVTWTVDPSDYLRGGHPEGIVRAVVRADEGERGRKSDEVVLLHDNQEQTVRALPEIIAYYEGSGRRFADVDELLAGKYIAH